MPACQSGTCGNLRASRGIAQHAPISQGAAARKRVQRVVDATDVSERSRTGKPGPAADVARATKMRCAKAVPSSTMEVACAVEMAATMATAPVTAAPVTTTAVTAATSAQRGARQHAGQNNNGNPGNQL